MGDGRAAASRSLPATAEPLPRLALAVGEPAGIGPDLIAMVAQRRLPARLVVIGDRALLEERARQLALPLRFDDVAAADERHAEGLLNDHIPLAVPAVPGCLDRRNSSAVLATLAHAVTGCISGRFDALVTAPVNKAVINEAGFVFTGQTEFLAERAGVARVVMMLVSDRMRVALATTHLPLREVANALTHESLTVTIRILRKDLVERFGIPRPRVLVAGLNPHAGESGHFGREEIDVIAPALELLRQEGFDLDGPLPADTLFTPERLTGADCVLAMYHDQGLPVLKYASFGRGVNVTLGLPFIRTSVDHGTALELAGTGDADPGSLLAAIELAIDLVRRNRARAGEAALIG